MKEHAEKRYQLILREKLIINQTSGRKPCRRKNVLQDEQESAP